MGWEKGKPRKPKETSMPAEVLEQPTETVELTPQMAAFLREMQRGNLENTIALAQELKKPDAETQAKLDEEKRRRVANALQLAQQTREGEIELAERQKSCAHSKANGKTAFVGQINSDNCYQLWCPYCHYTSPRIKAQPWQITEGLNLQKMSGITIAMLEKWAEGTVPDKLRKVPVGMMPDFSAA